MLSTAPLLNSETPVERCVAILIGINQYGNGIPPLRNAVSDVQTVAKVLAERYGYQVRLVLDDQASLAGLRALLAQFEMDVTTDTRVVFYFAGHGIAEETDTDAAGPQGFLIPQDARRDDQATFLPMAEVQALLSKLPCKHMLLFLDCCFAGAFRWSKTRSIRTRPATLYEERFLRYLRDPAWQVLASAAADERALDTVVGGRLGRRDGAAGNPENSPFAAALCRALTGEADLRIGGRPGDGIIVANELHLYLEDHFSKLERELQRTVQKPLLWSLDGKDKGQFVFFPPGCRRSLPSALDLVEKNNPYQGLEPYGQDKVDLFFGRAEVIEQLAKQAEAAPLTVVSGVSGSGKSSLVRAGLFSKLSKAGGWLLLPIIRPGNRSRAALSSLNGALGATADADFAATLTAWRTRNPDKKLFLCIDQLEELVTMGESPTQQAEFLAAIQAALSANAGYLHVVMTLRADFEPHFSDLLSPKSGTQVRFQLRPMNRQELRQVIEGPATERMLYLEPPSLVDQIIEEVAEMPGALPLLSFTMSELYRVYIRSGRSDRSLTEADYRQLGGVSGALRQRADEIFVGLDAESQQTLQRVMLRMVSLQAGEVARRRVPLSELFYGASHPEEARKEAVLGRLKEARLVVSGVDSEGFPYVEPAHDQIVLGWPQLWRYIKQEQETIALQRLVTQRAAEWQAEKRDRDTLLWAQDPRLPLLLGLFRQIPQRFNALESEFISLSEALRTDRERRKRRWRGGLIAGLCVIIAGLSALSWFAVRQSNESRRRLFELYAERGSDLLFQQGKPYEGLLWLHRALAEGSRDPALPYLLKTAMQGVDSSKALLVGHEAQVDSAAYSPDGRRIVTASWDKTARVWDADSGRLLFTLAGHQEHLTSAAYSPDGRRIVTASWDKTARVWDADSGRLLFTLAGHLGSIRSAAYRSDGRRILTGSEDGAARVWDADGGLPLFTLEVPGHDARGAAYSPDGRRIVTAHWDKTARIWEADHGQLLFALGTDSERHQNAVASAAYSPDGRRIVTASSDQTARVWDADRGQFLFALRGPAEPFDGAAYSPDGRHIVTRHPNGISRVWDAGSGQLLTGSDSLPALSGTASYRPDGGLIVTSTAQVFTADGKRLLSRLQGHWQTVLSATFSPDGHHIVTTSLDRTARVYDANSLRPATVLLQHGARVRSASFSADGRSIVTVSDDDKVRVWDLDDGRLLHELPEPVPLVHSAALRPDGHRIVTAGTDANVLVWDVARGRPVGELNAVAWRSPPAFRGDAIMLANQAAYSSDGRRLVAILRESQTAGVFAEEPLRLLGELKGHKFIVSVAWSPNGRRIVTASEDGTARVFDADSQAEAASLLRHESAVFGTAWSPDGRRIVTASSDKTAQVWDADSGRLLAKLAGHSAGVTQAAWSPDGRRIVTASSDETARVWDADSGRLLAVLAGHSGEVVQARWSPDGQEVITVGADDTVRRWDASRETRSAAELAQLLSCRVPVQFASGDSSIIRARMPSPSKCTPSARL